MNADRFPCSTSWKKRVEKGVPGKHNRDHHQRDGRDTHQQKNRRRDKRKNLILRFGVFGASTARTQRRRCGVRHLVDDAGTTEEDDDDGDGDGDDNSA